MLALCVILLAPCQGLPQDASTAQQLFHQARQSAEHGDNEHAIALYERLTHLAPSMPEAFNNLGALLYDAGRYDAALLALRRALSLDPQRGELHTLIGACLLAKGDPKTARHELEIEARLHPGDARNGALLVQAERADGDDLAVAHTLEKQMQQQPGNQEIVYQLGRAYLALSQQALLRAHDMDPDSALSHLMQGEIVEGAGDMKGAETEYKAAIAHAAGRADAHEHLGNVYWIQGLWAQASTEFTEALRLDPGNCQVLWKQGDILLNQQNDGTALPLLQQAVDRCPKLDQARVDRARALLTLGRAPDALPDLLAAERNSPEEPSIHFLLAKAYRAEGKANEAAAETAIFGRLSSKPAAGSTAP